MTTVSKTVVKTLRVEGIRYQLERTRCGKSTCRRCKEGAAHGPYWYSYQRRDGKYVRCYHGRTPPEQVTRALRHAEAQEERRRSLDHDDVIKVLTALDELGALLLQADEEEYSEPWDLGPEDPERLRMLADELEDSSRELAAAARRLRQRVRRCVTQLNNLAQETEEYLDEAEACLTDTDGQYTPS